MLFRSYKNQVIKGDPDALSVVEDVSNEAYFIWQYYEKYKTEVSAFRNLELEKVVNAIYANRTVMSALFGEQVSYILNTYDKDKLSSTASALINQLEDQTFWDDTFGCKKATTKGRTIHSFSLDK